MVRRVRALASGAPGLLALEGLLLVVAAVGALLGQVAVLLPALLLGAVAGAAAHRVPGQPVPGLGALGLVLRGLVVLAAAASRDVPGAVAVAAAAFGLLAAAGVVGDAVDQRVRGLRRHPATRGIPGVGSVPLVARPEGALTALLPECLLHLALLVGPGRPVLVGTAAAVGAAVCLGAWGVWAVRLRRARRRGRAVLEGVRRYLETTPPEVLLYAGDGPAALHEIAVWLPTMERLSSRVLLLMRSRDAFAALPPTTLPVACVPGATELLALPLDRARVALFVSNIGNNIHVLRLPGLRSAFIGHGDSDKSASANPYAKVYDQIWVAGPAGADRYLRAGVGVRPDALVEVGRPQVEGVRRGPLADPPVPTLLYAPTWEGWNADQDYSSVATHGAALVRAVLASPERVRLVYRPHPYTGRRSAAAAAAHREIVTMLRAANEAAGVGAATVLDAGPSGAGSPSAAEAESAAIAAGEERLRRLPPGAHVAVPSGSAPLVSCLNVADGLVTDVSSVLTDFLASDRPVAVCDPLGRDVAEFVERFPAAAGAVVLPAGDGRALDGVVAVVTGRAPDPAADRRRALRAHVLGPDLPPPLQRFDAAIAALAARPAESEEAATGDPAAA
ncbi:hypothetical protein ACI79C_01455 [Geodermatophilus sp. SYSU D00697]